ncbi:hypothetical protein Bbelb_017410 [Branchiostoma belcheri]|nr:hypothetical protein Bbelb_017410 [Branchiostoma belcheri]
MSRTVTDNPARESKATVTSCTQPDCDGGSCHAGQRGKLGKHVAQKIHKLERREEWSVGRFGDGWMGECWPGGPRPRRTDSRASNSALRLKTCLVPRVSIFQGSGETKELGAVQFCHLLRL